MMKSCALQRTNWQAQQRAAFCICVRWIEIGYSTVFALYISLRSTQSPHLPAYPMKELSCPCLSLPRTLCMEYPVWWRVGARVFLVLVWYSVVGRHIWKVCVGTLTFACIKITPSLDSIWQRVYTWEDSVDPLERLKLFSQSAGKGWKIVIGVYSSAYLY